jgi:hypothetical protein
MGTNPLHWLENVRTPTPPTRFNAISGQTIPVTIEE